MPETTKPKNETESPAPRKRRGCLFAILATIVLLAIAGALALTHLNGLVKQGVERFGPSLTGTAVNLDSVDISPLSGKGRLTGLTIDSPAGFDNTTFLRMEQASVALEVGPLLSGRLSVKDALAEGITLTAETGPTGSNAGIILEHLESFLAQTIGTKAQPSSGHSFALQNLVAKNIRAQLTTTGRPGHDVGLVAEVSELSGSLTDGTLQINGLVVNNPAGYADAAALSVPTVTIKFDPSTLTSDTLVIESVTIPHADAIYETSLAGSNFTAIENEIHTFETSLGGESKQAILIKQLTITSIKGQLSPSLLRNVGVKPTATLGPIHLTNLKSKSGAGLLAAIIGSIVTPVNGMGSGLMDGLGTVGKAIGEGAKQTGDVLQKGVGTVGKGVESTVKRLGGLFRKKQPETAPDDGIDLGDEK